MASFARNVQLLSLLLALIFLTTCDANSARVHVLITNEISEYHGRPNVTITLHCRSRDGDLGLHQVPYLSNYEFSFKPSIWGRSRYECSVKWDGECHRFVAYNQKKDKDKCRVCLWKIKPEAACRYNYAKKSYDCPPWWDWC